MKIRVISSREKINTLNPNEKIVHLAFRPSNTDILELTMKCPQVKALHIPSSYIRGTSNSSKMYLKMQGIELLEGDLWGHRKDINEYYEISQDMCDCIKQYRLHGMQEVDIIEKITRENRLCPAIVSFIIKNN